VRERDPLPQLANHYRQREENDCRQTEIEQAKRDRQSEQSVTTTVKRQGLFQGDRN